MQCYSVNDAIESYDFEFEFGAGTGIDVCQSVGSYWICSNSE